MKKNIFFGAVVFIMGASVGLNYVINSDGDRANNSRNVANLDAAPAVDAATMNWEQELAKTLSRDKKIKNTQSAEKPTVLDQMLFGELQGKYNLDFSGSELKAISLKNSESEGLNLSLQQIVNNYQSIFSKVSNFKQLSKTEDSETYQWQDAQGKSHQAVVKFNQHQMVQAVTFE